ncbi:MAG: LamG-like jellyroll fold domain-containing protein [Polyangiales bacterium]
MLRGLFIGGVLALAACGFRVDGDVPGDGPADVPGDQLPGGPWLTGFTTRKAIDLAGAPSELVDFVASIAEDADPDLVSTMTLVFTASDGVTQLPSEIVAFDRVSGKLEAAVRTTLAANTKTRIYLYYGAAPAPNATTPWGSMFAGVWHMGSAGATNEIVRDSKKLNDATATPTDIPLPGAGIVGEARLYDGIDDSMAIVDPTDGSLDFGIRSFTVGLWVKVDQSQSFYDMPLFKGGSSAGNAGYDFELGTNTWLAGFADNTGASVVNPIFGLEVNLLHDWHYLVAQCDRTAVVVRTFLDGVQVDSLPFNRGSLDSGYFVRFGDPSYRFRGQLDEIHIYGAAISADWIASEYANVAKRASFQTIQPAELRE